MIVIGLTGGIASGKSTAADMLRELGATIIDADRLGHRSYEPGTPGFQKVVNAFGHDIVGKDGTIDRRILGGKVFGAPGQMERLNSIVWPEIRNLIEEEVRQISTQDPDAAVVLEAAVLLEAGWQDLCDEVWVVYTPVPVAVERLKTRNNLSEDAAMARIDAQMSNKDRLDVADVKIENASTTEQLEQKVERAWRALQTRMPAPRTPAAKKPVKGPAKAAAPKTPAAPKATAASKTTASKTAAPKAATSKTTASKATAKAAPKTAAKAAKPAGAAKAPAKAATRTAPKATTKTATATSATAKKAPARATSKAAAPKAAAKAAPKPAKPSKAAPKAAARPARTAAARKPAVRSTARTK